MQTAFTHPTTMIGAAQAVPVTSGCFGTDASRKRSDRAALAGRRAR
jgi:hypothetical protein